MQRGEGDGHGEGGGVGDIEGFEALIPPDGARAVADRSVGGAVELHALLDDIERVHEGVAGDGGAGTACGCGKWPNVSFTGRGFRRIRSGNYSPAATGWCPAAFPPMACLITSYAAKYTACAGPEGVC